MPSSSTEVLIHLHDTISRIDKRAHDIHARVNQHYGNHLPYSYHLNQVVSWVKQFVTEIVTQPDDILPVIFAAYFHDSIEDARLTYNDVQKIAIEYMNENQAFTATEIVYALTNEKGRTRAERAGESYYSGIRKTPYAPFIKLCDRLANMEFSFQQENETGRHMCEVYRNEWNHFIESITSTHDDSRFKLPQSGITYAEKLMKL